jgi:hypothetical protein
VFLQVERSVTLLGKLLFTPFVAFFAMLVTMAILSSVMGMAFIRETIGDSGLTIFLIWLPVVAVVTIMLHFRLNKSSKKF